MLYALSSLFHLLILLLFISLNVITTVLVDTSFHCLASTTFCILSSILLEQTATHQCRCYHAVLLVLVAYNSFLQLSCSVKEIFKGSSVLFPSPCQTTQEIIWLSLFVGMAETRERMKQHNRLNTPSLSGMLLALKFPGYCLTKNSWKLLNIVTWTGEKKEQSGYVQQFYWFQVAENSGKIYDTTHY